jgi:hypothetical protein
MWERAAAERQETVIEIDGMKVRTILSQIKGSFISKHGVIICIEAILPDRLLSEVYFFLILPNSLSTRSFSASLVLQLRNSWM